MSGPENKLSLVGWGDEQVLIHGFQGNAGVSIWRRGRLKSFSLTPWLYRHLGLYTPCESFKSPSYVLTVTQAKTYRKLRLDAVREATEAVRSSSIERMAEAIAATYNIQRMLGGDLLPNHGEMAKRVVGRVGLYLFREPVNASKHFVGHLASE